MSADSNPPSSPDLPPLPPSVENAGPLPPMKRRHKKPEAAENTENPDNEIIVLSSLLQNLLARKQGTETTETEGEVRAKINRFVPRGASAGTPAPASPPPLPAEGEVPPPGPAVSPSARPETVGPEAMAAIAFPKFEPRAFEPDPDVGYWQRGSLALRVLYFAFAAVLALGAFLVGRGEGRRATAVSLPAKPVPDAALATWAASFSADLDRALASDQAGDLEAARQTAENLQTNMGPNPVLSAYLATVNTRLGRTNDVEADLSRLLGPATPPAATAVLDEAQGFNYARRREFERAAECFTATAQIQPFNLANLLHLAESQRRAGRLTEAIETFQQAMLRLLSGAPESADLRGYLAFKRRLSQVEIGREADFKDEMEQQLAAPNPSPYWLLTTAALGLQKGDLPTAVGALQKAQAALPPARFAALVNDYFFRSFAHHAELAPFLANPTPGQVQTRRRSMDFFIDP